MHYDTLHWAPEPYKLNMLRWNELVQIYIILSNT